MKAHLAIRGRPEPRFSAMHAGLLSLGYQVEIDGDAAASIAPDDILVIWNRYGGWAEVADKYEAAGARVVVCENGYYGQTTAMSIGWHNGRGRHNVGGRERFDALGIEFKPWRTRGSHILVCGQRGIGYGGVDQAESWAADLIRRLCGMTPRPILFRPHPAGQRRPRFTGAESVDCRQPLAEQLRDCWAVVVWTSNSATAALIAGVPVFYEGPALITAKAATKGIALIETPPMPDRVPAFVDLAWGQWTLEEIGSGAAFKHLLAA